MLLLDGDYDHTLAVARELHQHLGAHILGVSSSPRSHLSRSRHTAEDLRAPLPSDPSYSQAVQKLIELHLPEVVVPVGYHSTAVTTQLADSLPHSVKAVAPDSRYFDIAVDKIATYRQAQRIGVRSPHDYTERVTNSGSPQELPYPFVAKARHERGGSTITVIHDEADFLCFNDSRAEYEYLYQEYIDASPQTYAFSGFFHNGEPVVAIGHEEKRSVPRSGGSGTRVRSSFDRETQEAAVTLLRALDWTGIAQVEFKRNRTGELVLMEINPKVWASYALASRAGAHIVSTAVQHAIGAPLSRTPNYREIEMTFPLREGYYVSTHRGDESIPRALGAMLWPPARFDFELRDLPAYLPKRK